MTGWVQHSCCDPLVTRWRYGLHAGERGLQVQVAFRMQHLVQALVREVGATVLPARNDQASAEYVTGMNVDSNFFLL